MDSLKLSKICSFKWCKTVDSDTLVFSNNDDLFVILSELETSDNSPNSYFVPENNRIRTVDHETVAIFSN